MSRPNLHHAENEGWHRHSTRVQPVPSDTRVEPWFGFGRGKYTYFAKQLNWAGFNEETRIKGYRIIADEGAA